VNRLDRVVSKFLKGNANKREKIHIFFEDFLSDLKKLTHIIVRKLSADEIFIKDRLILNILSAAERYIENFNAYMQYHSEQWVEIVKEFKSLKALEQDEDLKEEIKLFKQNLMSHLEVISEKAYGLINQLEFLENKYKLTKEQIKQTSILKTKLHKIFTTRFDTIINQLLSGKLQIL